MKLSRQTALVLLAVLLALLLFGTQMPGAWHDVLLDKAGATLGLLGVAYADRQLKSWK